MPELLRQAFVAAEDRRFYEHDGVGHLGDRPGPWCATSAAAAVEEAPATITQAAGPHGVPQQERTPGPQAQRGGLGRQDFERQLSKQEILDQYINYVYLGSGRPTASPNAA